MMPSKENKNKSKEIIVMAKFADHMEKVSNGVVEGYKKIEDGVVTGYKKIEDGVVKGFTGITEKVSGVMLDEEGNLKTGKVGEAVVGAYKKIEDAFVNTFMAKEASRQMPACSVDTVKAAAPLT